MSDTNVSTINLNESNESSNNENYKKAPESNKPKSILMSNRFERVKEVLLEWSSRTDTNNYGKIFDYQGNILAQLIWTIIFLGLTALTVLLIQLSISAYLDYSVTSTYETVYQNPSEFPTLTVCARNPFVTQQAISFFEELISNYSIQKTGLNSTSLTELITLAKMHAANPYYGDENRKKLGLSIDNITSCQFNNKDCKNDLHWIWLYDYGNCFQFNSGLNWTNQKIELARATRSDKNSGLNIEFSNLIKFDYYYPLFDSYDTSESSYRYVLFAINDFVVFVHNSSNLISSNTKSFYFTCQINFVFGKDFYSKRTSAIFRLH